MGLISDFIEPARDVIELANVRQRLECHRTIIGHLDQLRIRGQTAAVAGQVLNRIYRAEFPEP